MSTIKATNFQHASAANPALVLAADGSATANVSSINNGPLAGFRNAIINGNFDHWQRGTSFTNAEYGADRWLNGRTGSASTMTRQSFTLGQSDVPGEPAYFCRMAVSSVAGAANYVGLFHRIEGVRAFAGQTVSISFWIKADANKTVALEFRQDFGTGGSPSSDVNAIGVTKKSVTAAWQKITHTATIPSVSGKALGTDGNNYLQFNIWLDAGSNFNTRTDTLGQQSGTFDIAQVQIEPGPVATPFELRPIGTELALCQRYYETSDANGSLFSGNVTSGQGYFSAVDFATNKRGNPNITLTNSSNVSFDSTPGTTFVGKSGFRETRGANATARGLYLTSWTAEAEL